MFESLQLGEWRQFSEVEIHFHQRLTVLTGANGAGKTTILNLLGQHFGWDIALISTPALTRKGLYRYYSGAAWEDTLDSDEAGAETDRRPIGKLRYTTGEEATLEVPTSVGESYRVQIRGAPNFEGLFLPSHHPVYSYRRVTEVPTQLDAHRQLFEGYLSNIKAFFNPRVRVESPSYRLKAALISLAVFGYGNAVVQPNDAARETFTGFEDVLKTVLPADLGFQRLSVRMPDVVLECQSGDFALDAASGGVAVILDMAWQLHMMSRIADEFVVLVDEPENHLHPKLQRSLFPALMSAFPSAQFIATTHNPFIVTAVPDSSVYVLSFTDNGVQSRFLDAAEKSGSADRVLAEVLGVPFPRPLWVENELNEIVRRYSSGSITAERLQELRNDLSRLGFEQAFPDAVERWAAGDEA